MGLEICGQLLDDKEYEEFLTSIAKNESGQCMFTHCRNEKYLVSLHVAMSGQMEELRKTLEILKQGAHFRPIAIPAYLGYREYYSEAKT